MSRMSEIHSLGYSSLEEYYADDVEFDFTPEQEVQIDTYLSEATAR